MPLTRGYPGVTYDNLVDIILEYLSCPGVTYDNLVDMICII